MAKQLEAVVGRQSSEVHLSGCTSRLRRPYVRRLCTIGVLAIAASLVGGVSASADVGETPVPAFHEIVADRAPHTAAHLPRAEPVGSKETVPLAERRHRGEASAVSDVQADGDGDRQARDSRSQNSADVVEKLQTRLADPILMAVGPSSSHGLSFQEGDPQYPLPFDGFLGDQAKAVLTGGSSRSSKSKAATSIAGGADPHWVNQLCASRTQVAYGARSAAVPDQGTAMRRGCAQQKLQSRSPAPRRAGASAEAGGATSSTGADSGEGDQPGSPASRPVSAAIGQLSFWYVSAADTGPEAVRVEPDEPSFSPD